MKYLILLLGLIIPLKADDLQEVRKILRSHYVHEIPDSILMLPTIDSILKVLNDPYCSYDKGDQAEYLLNYFSDKSSNLGLDFYDGGDSIPVVSDVVYQSPAYYAGLLEDDTVYAIDDTSLVSSSWFNALKRTYGSTRDLVRFLIHRGSQELTIEVPRKPFADPEIVHYLDDNGTVFFRITSFNTHLSFVSTSYDTDSYIHRVLSKHRSSIHRVVIDARSCSGGTLIAVTNLIKLFARKYDLMYSIKNKESGHLYKRTTKQGEFCNIPLEILVGRRSASASEILANAVLDNDYGSVVGDTTYGKGTAIRIAKFQSGATFMYTTGMIYAPSGRCIDRHFGTGGVVPEIPLNSGPPINWKNFIEIKDHLQNVQDIRRKHKDVDTAVINQIIQSLPGGLQQEAEYTIARLIWSELGRIWYTSTLPRYTRWAKVYGPKP